MLRQVFSIFAVAGICLSGMGELNLFGAEPKIFPIIIGLTRDGRDADESIGAGVQVSGERLGSALQKAFGPTVQPITWIGFSERGPITTNKPMDLQTINREIPAALNKDAIGKKFDPAVDTIFCYVLAHGAHDPRVNDRVGFKAEFGHWFELERNDHYFRSDLFELLLDQRGPIGSQNRYKGLTVLISDTCNVPFSTGEQLKTAAPPVANPYEALRYLLTKFEGRVSISATDLGEKANYRDSKGGVFTELFLEAVKSEEKIGWRELVSNLQREAVKFTRDNRGAQKFTPTWMRTPASIKLRAP